MPVRLRPRWKDQHRAQADREDGLAPPAAGDRGGGGKDESAELRELRRRTKLLEQENEILRRATAYFARDVLPK